MDKKVRERWKRLRYGRDGERLGRGGRIGEVGRGEGTRVTGPLRIEDRWRDVEFHLPHWQESG